jgi:uncharacterized protein YndB with AHSA1/START domain
MSVSSEQPTNVSEREIVSTRLIDASRDLVFKAWTDPHHLVQWWGPKGFTNTFHEFEPRPGGRWRFVMHGPDGRDYQNESVFAEVVRPERIVFDHISGPQLFASRLPLTMTTARLELLFVSSLRPQQSAPRSSSSLLRQMKRTWTS